MKHLIIILLSLSCIFNMFAQLPDYVTNQYPYTVTKDISYGMATAYDGSETELVLDIYKPVNDNNCKRPLLMLVHGGAWIGGTKEDYNIVGLALHFASKGWVVASIKYRLGVHTTANYTKYLLCPANDAALCIRTCDTSEVFRGIFRGVQDTRGAIRFMKLRAAEDSTDIKNVFVAGESAGAFISMYTAFMDRDEEKPLSCYAIADAPVADPELGYCHKPGKSLARPDLGDIHGTLHLGVVDDSIQGVGCFYGGLADLSIMDDKQMPAYIFHQASDVLVHYKRSRLLSRLSDCLNNICEPFYHMPRMSGGYLLRKYFQDLGTAAPPYKADILENSTALDCTVNPPGHSIDNIALRSKNMAELFAPIILANGNDPLVNCKTSSVPDKDAGHIRLFPSPGKGYFVVSGIAEPTANITLSDLFGREIATQTRKIDSSRYEIHVLGTIPSGMYICNIISPNNRWSKAWFCENN